MKFKEVWISTKEHQIEFNKVLQQNSWLRKATGLYKLPANFPYIRILWQKLPIVYNKRFSLEINENEIKLIPNNEFGIINRAKNINIGIDNPIILNEIISKNRYMNPKPFMKTFNINWIQIKFHHNEKEEEILLSAGGKFMPMITKETNNISNAIDERIMRK